MIASWPSERPAVGARAVFKAAPEDFQVEELGAFEPSGQGEHLYLRLRKTSLSTPEVAHWLAHCFGVPEWAVGYAGMKDKHAVTEQWFSVHTPQAAGVLPGKAGVEIRAASRHSRKLRRGQLAGNRFHVRLRDVVGEGWADRVSAIREAGVPNYFGPQRFGIDNLAQARQWLARGRRRSRDFRSGLHLSVLRSFLFNEVLALRVGNGTWNRLLPGDVLMVLPQPGEPGRGDETASTREVPTGPLWGRGRSAAEDQARALEQQALAPHGELRDGLEHAGVEQQRRSLVLKAPDLQWRTDHRDLHFTFTLPPGGYATTLLGGAFRLAAPGAGS